MIALLSPIPKPDSVMMNGIWPNGFSFKNYGFLV